MEVEADARIKITKKSSETYNLTFNVVKYEDAGEWSFKAENEVGEVWTKTTVIVEGISHKLIQNVDPNLIMNS